VNRVPRIAIVLVLLGAAQAAQAHNLVRADSDPTTWHDPLPIERPDVSQVYYARLEAVRRQVWFRFSGKAGDRIWFQVGVPVLERLAGLVPRAAVVGPGLPVTDVGFELPPGLGALVFEPSGRPREFHEEFTGTSSWIWLEQEFVLPSSGTWYIAAFSDAAASDDDKLWLAIGTKERFGLGDILRLGSIRRFVRKFHEVR
jgi:hypothetical protein